ncbi:EAL domain-containing protein [Adonisia turfae]|uniref:EAL domain-containing protein n=1 Tax=Adonisia turfae CCMR0081 TaxID=2292702 RepID=A0A6M0RPL6_9CYAN|nr:EAL domain-containing protein [Adonisia turfae]NEZ58187.1 EAL domain-containing protein [Adonisia turfae CCMR0081]
MSIDPDNSELAIPSTEGFSNRIEFDQTPLIVEPQVPLSQVLSWMSQGEDGQADEAESQSQDAVSDRPRPSSYCLVMSGEQLLGIFTERDVVKIIAQDIDLSAFTIAEVMSRGLITISPGELERPFNVVALLRRHNIRHLPVLDDQHHLVGVVTHTNLRQALKAADLLRLRRVHEAMSTHVVTALADERLLGVIRLMATHQVSCVVIVDVNDGKGAQVPIGIVTERDIVKLQAQNIDLSALVVEAVMSKPLQCVAPEDSLWTVQKQMQTMGVRRLVVADQGALSGLVTQTSILSMLDPSEMYCTIQVLREELNRLQDQRLDLLQAKASQLEQQVKVSESRFRAIFDHTFQFIGLLEPDGTLIEANQAALDFVGLSQEDVINLPFWQTPWWRLSAAIQAQLRKNIERSAQGEFIRYEVDVIGGNNQVITIDFSLSPVKNDAGEVILIIPEGRDISDRKRIEIELEESQNHYASLTAAAPVGIFRADRWGDCVYVNERWCKIAGLSLEDALGTGWAEAIHCDDRMRVSQQWHHATQTSQTFQAEYRLQTPAGSVTWVFGQAVPQYDNDGDYMGYVGTITDITEHKQLEAALEAEKEMAQVTLDSIGDAVITTDAAGNVRHLNPIAETMTGWTTQTARGRPLTQVFQIINETTREPAINPVEQVLLVGLITGLANHTILIRRDGQEFSIEDSAAPIRNKSGQLIGVVMVFHDVTQSRSMARQLSWQATHDTLTELFNRRYFEAELEDIVTTAVQQNQSHVLCYLDLDQFKVVNDTSGHLAGDELLRQLARLLKRHIRAVDIIARLGGDEFGILLAQCPLDRAVNIAEDLRQAIADYPFIWQEKIFRVGVSIGLVVIDSNSTDAIAVMSAADAACYAAKYRGRNRIQIYQKDNAELNQQRQERHWSVVIRQALENDRFCLYRQQIAQTINPQGTPIAFYEVLVRMIRDSGENISPGEFIPAAERYGLMPMLDRWIIRNCLANLEQVLQDGIENVLYSINLSGMSLNDEHFLEYVSAQFERFNVPPECICFEITETAAIADFECAISFIRALNRLGCRFALDDFGSGMSSFAYLKALPVDFLKIDGDFIQGVITDSTTEAIIESIHRIGHVMGLQTIAESVENEAILTKMQTIGVDYVQGYGISYPSFWC